VSKVLTVEGETFLQPPVMGLLYIDREWSYKWSSNIYGDFILAGDSDNRVDTVISNLGRICALQDSEGSAGAIVSQQDNAVGFELVSFYGGTPVTAPCTLTVRD
jgi:hypothetical protein